jgi:hypothetical protein
LRLLPGAVPSWNERLRVAVLFLAGAQDVKANGDDATATVAAPNKDFCKNSFLFIVKIISV